jgi:hypothetical protein
MFGETMSELPSIKFSHAYCKMPPCFWSREKHVTHLIGVSVIDDISKLPELFIKYDTAYIPQGITDIKEVQYYKLPFGKILLLVLFTVEEFEGIEMTNIWTTVRRWTPDKEKYYVGLIGKQVDIIIED